MSNANDALAQMIAEAQDAPAFFTKDSQVGASVSGTITNISIRQVRDFKTRKPLQWDDGSPQQQLVVIADRTDSATGEQTAFSLYVKWWGNRRKEFAKAILDAGVDVPEVGGTITATYTGDSDAPRDPGMDAEKLYSYSYVPPAQTSAQTADPNAAG